MTAFINLAAALSVILSFYAVIPYLISIIHGKTKPHQLSWIIFTIMNGIIFLSQYLAGGRRSVLIALVAFIDNLAIVILSFRYGVRETSRWDKILFTAALVTILVWILTDSNATAIWLTVLIDIAASTILILKIRRYPESENLQAWSVVTVAYLCSTLTLSGKPLGILYVRPVYGFISDGAYAVAILYYRRHRLPSKL